MDSCPYNVREFVLIVAVMVQNTIAVYINILYFNCSWVDTRWQQYSTHLHTNSTQNSTMKQNKTHT